MTLEHCRILVTQTEPGNQTLQHLLAHHQGEAVLCPLTSVTHRSISSFKAKALHHAQAFIFLSPHAVYSASSQLDLTSFDAQMLAIGPSTAACLMDHGLHQVSHPPKYTRQALAQWSVLSSEPLSLVLFCSADHHLKSPSLKTLLKAHGHQVTSIITHQQTPRPLDDLIEFIGEQTFDVITCHSQKGLQALQILQKKQPSLKACCLCLAHADMLSLAKGLGMANGPLICCENPTPQAMVQALLTDWHTHQH